MLLGGSGQPHMSILSIRDGLLMSSFSVVRRSGLLGTSVGRRLFRAAYFLYKGYIEDNLQELVRLRPGLLRAGNVLDVGANIGYTASVLARTIDPGYRVHAFEPEPFNYQILQETAARPEFGKKINALQFAVGAEDGSIELWQNMRHHADHRVITDQFRSEVSGVTGIRIPMVSIDRFLERNPGPVSFVKIDVQGFELPVCQGMKTTLEKNPNLTLVVEYAPSAMRALGFSPSTLIGFLVDRAFQVYLVCPNGKLSPGIPSGLDDSGYVDLLFSRRPIACEGHA
jgi:FkbM family methyltransferase